MGKTVSRRRILENFLDTFENRIQTIDCKRIIDQWKTHTSTIGTRVRIETLTEVHEGLAVDVDETGALIIEDTTGQTRRIIYGDCFYA
jgi:BirA family biotin operon repressor/biotin-[acetyl-CoA-carboxylase] ligase